MNRWKIVLKGGEDVYISDSEKLELEKNLEDGGLIEINRQWIDTKSIKGIFSLDTREEDKQANNWKHIEEIDKEFNQDCLNWSRKTPEEKAIREMKIRIVPFWSFENGKREDRIMLVIYEWVKAWFKFNPKFPRCPARIWMPFIQMVKPKKAYNLFLKYVLRNDWAIDEWVKYSSSS